jgi:hypothetical protein
MEVGSLLKAHYMKPHAVDVPRLYNNYDRYVIIDGTLINYKDYLCH